MVELVFGGYYNSGRFKVFGRVTREGIGVEKEECIEINKEVLRIMVNF